MRSGPQTQSSPLSCLDWRAQRFPGFKGTRQRLLWESLSRATCTYKHVWRGLRITSALIQRVEGRERGAWWPELPHTHVSEHALVSLAARVNLNRELFEDSLRVSPKERETSWGHCFVKICMLLSWIKGVKYVYWQNTFEGKSAISPLVLKNCNLKNGENVKLRKRLTLLRLPFQIKTPAASCHRCEGVCVCVC